MNETVMVDNSKESFKLDLSEFTIRDDVNFELSSLLRSCNKNRKGYYDRITRKIVKRIVDDEYGDDFFCDYFFETHKTDKTIAGMEDLLKLDANLAKYFLFNSGYGVIDHYLKRNGENYTSPNRFIYANILAKYHNEFFHELSSPDELQTAMKYLDNFRLGFDLRNSKLVKINHLLRTEHALIHYLTDESIEILSTYCKQFAHTARQWTEDVTGERFLDAEEVISKTPRIAGIYALKFGFKWDDDKLNQRIIALRRFPGPQYKAKYKIRQQRKVKKS